MDKNKISLISKNYANALIEISKQDNSFEDFKIQLQQVSDTINSSNDLKLVMDNSSVSYINKIEIIENIFKDKIDLRILNLLKILIEKNRFDEFDSITQAYCEIADNFERKKDVEIISSVELEIDIKGKILNKLEQKLHSEVMPRWTVDESLIGGLVFKFGDVVIDTSIKSKLENLSKYMLR